MKQLPLLLLAILLLLACQPRDPQLTGPFILLDGRFDDWAGLAPVATAPTHSASDSSVNFSKLWITDDAEYLFLRLELDRDILLQEQNGITLYLDVDDDPNTGEPINGLGVEIGFTFGERQGWAGTPSDTIEYEVLGLRLAPTTAARAFEIGLAWQASPVLEELQFGARPFRIALVDKRGASAMPTVLYRPQKARRPAAAAFDFEKQDSAHFRLVTHNVNRRHFDADKRAAFTRVYSALQPDLLLLEEAYAGTAAEILDYFRPALGASLSGEWYAYKAGEEATVVLSPVPATEVIPLGNSAAYLLDLRPFYDTDLALVVLSMPCCRQDSARQAEADRIMAFVRDLQTPGGTVTIPANTPIVLAGDANLVGPIQQQRTLTHGEIQDTTTYGPPFAPDWDQSPLTDLFPRHLQRPMTYTWLGEGFAPSRLDYILFSDSVLDIGKNFVFDTAGLPQAILDRYRLQAEDAAKTYKHYPVVADLVLSAGR